MDDSRVSLLPECSRDVASGLNPLSNGKKKILNLKHGFKNYPMSDDEFS